MIRQHIHLMCGIPGSGKSTWIKKQIKDDKSICISRDEVRKSFVGENVDKNNYFSKEDEVFAEFVLRINDAISQGYSHIYIDATHISPSSRSKVLNQLYVEKDTALIIEVFQTPIEECVRRNGNRTGFAKVPDSAIYNMYRGFTLPSRKEFSLRNYGFERISINEHEYKEGNSL